MPYWVKIDQKMSQKLFLAPKMTKNDQKQKFGLRRGFFGPNQKVQKTKYVFTRPIHPPEVVSNQNFEIDTLSPPSIKSVSNIQNLEKQPRTSLLDVKTYRLVIFMVMVMFMVMIRAA